MNTLKLDEILQSFCEISGMDVAIISAKNKIIARRYSGALFCANIHKSQKCMDMCLESDRCGMEKACEARGLYVYKCPFGIYEALMPISKNDEIVAYLFVGMGIQDDKRERMEILDRALSVSPDLNRAQIEKSIRDLPHFPKEKLDAFASLLPIIAEYIEANNLLADNDMTIGQLIKTYVKNNISKKITLADISWNLHCSTVTLTEHFKAEYGMTIMDYVLKKRMERAERLLRNSDLSVREVASECGFSDDEYFSRCFKKTYGKSPKNWRRENSVDRQNNLDNLDN